MKNGIKKYEETLLSFFFPYLLIHSKRLKVK
nr:MAG TPA_asm: hypothetical protein [Bacteriophage sp.]